MGYNSKYTGAEVESAIEKALNLTESSGSIVATDDDISVEQLAPDVVSEAIRKTPQTLSDAEKLQARANISAVSASEVQSMIEASIVNTLNTPV